MDTAPAYNHGNATGGHRVPPLRMAIALFDRSWVYRRPPLRLLLHQLRRGRVPSRPGNRDTSPKPHGNATGGHRVPPLRMAIALFDRSWVYRRPPLRLLLHQLRRGRVPSRPGNRDTSPEPHGNATGGHRVPPLRIGIALFDTSWVAGGHGRFSDFRRIPAPTTAVQYRRQRCGFRRRAW